MQLNNIQIALRPRTHWQALDLGSQFLAAWWRPALFVWLASYGIFGMLLLLLFSDNIAIAQVLLWWLKPLFDRFVLLVYSQKLFNEPTSLAATLAQFPRILKSPGLLSSLTLRRLSLNRSYLLPVWLLEQQSGKAARLRFSVLRAQAGSQASWLTILGAHAVIIVGLSLFMVIFWLLPSPDDIGFFEWLESGDQSGWRGMLLVLCYLVAETLVELWYVASGFALYLQRRMNLEGWDMELIFRRMSERATSLNQHDGNNSERILTQAAP